MNLNQIRRTSRLILVAFFFYAGLSTCYGQIGPTLSTPIGIYGSAPEAFRSDVAYVRLINVDMDAPGFTYILPVNGLSNFNFLYTSDGAGFLPGGVYEVQYLDKTQTIVYTHDTFIYSPNSGHTNGYQIRPFYSPPPTPRGIHGYILAYVPGGGGATVPLAGAIARVGHASYLFNRAIANGDGYFSIYYSSQFPGQFLPPDTHYDLVISGTLNGCSYSWRMDNWAIWLPYADYITAAEWDNGTVTLSGMGPGCQP